MLCPHCSLLCLVEVASRLIMALRALPPLTSQSQGRQQHFEHDTASDDDYDDAGVNRDQDKPGAEHAAPLPRAR